MPAPGPEEHLIASMHVERVAHNRLVEAAIETSADDLGLSDESASHLAGAACAVVDAIRAKGYDVPTDPTLDVALVRIGHRAVVRIDDQGLPFNTVAEDAADAEVIGRALAHGWLDEVRHESLGREGNRTVLVRHADVDVDLRARDDASAGLPEQPGAVEPIAADLPIDVRRATGDDVDAICRLTWRTYGFTYQHDEYYQPARLAAMLADGVQASFVAVLPDGEVVGHSAVLLERADDVVVEGGRAMVDPRFRGHHLMGAARDLRDSWMREHGVLALEGAAVTAHTRSQRDAPVTSMQLAFLPPITFEGIEGSETAYREAVVGGLMPVAPIPEQAVVTPARDAAMVAEIYRLNDLVRTLIDGAAPSGDGSSELDLHLRADLGHAVVDIGAIQADFAEAIRARMLTAATSGIGVVYADIPLDARAASWAADVLAGEGFVFAGVVPLSRGGVDVVRYQWLGDTLVDPASIHLKHPFAQELLAYVLDQRAAGDAGRVTTKEAEA